MKNSIIKNILTILYTVIFFALFLNAGPVVTRRLNAEMQNIMSVEDFFGESFTIIPFLLLYICVVIRTLVNRATVKKVLLVFFGFPLIYRFIIYVLSNKEFILSTNSIGVIYFMCIPVIYVICLYVIRNEPETPKEVDSSTYSGGSYGYSGGSYGYSGGSYSSARTEEANFDANRYVKNHCSGYIYGLSTDTDKQRIDSDPDLTDEQKEDAKRELDSLAALYY